MEKLKEGMAMTLDLRSLGIGIQTSFENAPRDYELLYVSKDLAYVPVNAMDKIRIWEHNLEADKIRAGLPKRIVVGGAVNLSRRDALCALTNSCLDPPQDANSILQVYDEWIQFLLERRDLKQVNLSFFFEWLQTAATHWKQVNQRKPCYVSELIPKSGGPDVVRNGMLHHAKAITLWRHISLREFFENVIQPNGADRKSVV